MLPWPWTFKTGLQKQIYPYLEKRLEEFKTELATAWLDTLKLEPKSYFLGHMQEKIMDFKEVLFNDM